MIFNYSFQDPLVPYVLVVHYMMRWHHLILHMLWHGEDFSLQYFCTVQNKFKRSSLYNIWDCHTYFLSHGDFYQLVKKLTSGNQLTVENDWIFQIFFLILCSLISTQANGKKRSVNFFSTKVLKCKKRTACWWCVETGRGRNLWFKILNVLPDAASSS